MPILEVKDLVYRYNQEKTVLNKVNAEFNEGVFYALVGKSGAGKSTLLSLLAGLDIPDEGVVLFNGNSTKEIDTDDYRKKDVSVIYQDFELFPFMTVLENIMYPMNLNGMDADLARNIAKELASKVSLNELLFDHYPSEISGGEQQRVAIARALSMDRRLILADEPTGNLDSENSETIIDILKRLAHEDKKCIIVVTHDISVMEEADVVFMIKDGTLIKKEI